jgi:hypothetical protein
MSWEVVKVGSRIQMMDSCDNSWPEEWYSLRGQMGHVIELGYEMGGDESDPFYKIRLVEGTVVHLWREEFIHYKKEDFGVWLERLKTKMENRNGNIKNPEIQFT